MRPKWRPYSVGYWEDTADGWLWHSQFAWGRIPFHYGRWVTTSVYGWVWVPGYTYAPSWVVWTTDNDYVGWAPLPPQARWQGGVLSGATIFGGAWVFCPQTLFRQRVVRFVPAPYRLGRRARYQRYYRPRGYASVRRSRSPPVQRVARPRSRDARRAEPTRTRRTRDSQTRRTRDPRTKQYRRDSRTKRYRDSPKKRSRDERRSVKRERDSRRKSRVRPSRSRSRSPRGTRSGRGQSRQRRRSRSRG